MQFSKFRDIPSAWISRQKVAFRDFFKSRSGATGIEYGIIVALVSVLIAGTLAAASTNLTSMFMMLVNAFST